MPPFPTRASKMRTEHKSLSLGGNRGRLQGTGSSLPHFRDSRDLPGAEHGGETDMDQVSTLGQMFPHLAFSDSPQMLPRLPDTPASSAPRLLTSLVVFKHSLQDSTTW